MDWKKVAIDDLRHYRCLKDALKNLNDNITNLVEDSISLKSGLSNPEPIKGGGTKQEDKMINMIVKKERLKLNQKAIQALMKMIERGLNNLNENELSILKYFYMEEGRKISIDCLCNKMGYEKSRIYQIRNDGLKKFTMSMYGIIDL